jgi:hypothetical protein
MFWGQAKSRLLRQLLDSNQGGDFLQGAKALARDVTVVNETPRSIVCGPNSETQGIAAPDNHASYLHGTSISKIPVQDQPQRGRQYIKGTTGKRSPGGKAYRPCSLVLS